MILRHTACRRGKLLSFLRGELKLSCGLIGHLKYQNCFFVDGSPAHTDRIVEPGQEITVTVREQRPTEFRPEYAPLSVLLEDEWVLAVDKPAGVIVHPTFHRTEGTLLTRVLGYYEQTGQEQGIHLVNRLDRDTFGVVLLAKNAYVHSLLYAAQRRGEFRKTYHALCLGAPERNEGLWEQPIGRVEGGSLLRRIDPAGQTAATEYRLLAHREGISLLELHPLTGRTHQLRLHCLAAGLPILGDPQYFTGESRLRSEALGLSGQQLCAAELTFPHPMTGVPTTVRSRLRVAFP